MAAPWTRWPPASCRSPWAKRPRPSPMSWTAPRPTASRPLGRSPLDRRCRGRGHRHQRRPARRTTRSVPPCPAFTGDIDQVPPIYSALKLEGERAYELARRGETPELASRQVRIDRLDLLDGRRRERRIRGQGAAKAPISAPWPAIWRRLWARSAMSPNCAARHAARSRKANAISLDKLDAFGAYCRVDFVLPVATALDDIPALAVTEDEAQCLSRGQPIPVSGPDAVRVAVAGPPNADRAGPCCGSAGGVGPHRRRPRAPGAGVASLAL